MKKIILAAVAVSAIAASASAQQVMTYTFERKVSSDETPQVVLDKIKAEQAHLAVQTKTTLNAPYSGEATTESIQVLADGNRIVHRTATRVYRDSAGRTRKETLDADGQVVMIAINDPATGTAYVFDPRVDGAVQSVVKMRSSGGVEGGAVAVVQGTAAATVVVDKEKAEAEQVFMKERVPVPPGGVLGGAAGWNTFYYVSGAPEKGETTKEDLGQQTIEGVTASGTRTTTVIPAGAIGNEQPIKVVSEEWTSPELQVLVLTRHSDPRSGETTYRLTGIGRTEPSRALFEAPAKKQPQP